MVKIRIDLREISSGKGSQDKERGKFNGYNPTVSISKRWQDKDRPREISTRE
jgi:hypothetical protein